MINKIFLEPLLELIECGVFIGSRAILSNTNLNPYQNYKTGEFFYDSQKPINDIDIVCLKKDIKFDFDKNKNIVNNFIIVNDIKINVEIHIADDIESLKIIYDSFVTDDEIITEYLPYELLYAIKRGHMTFDIKWLKNIHQMYQLKNKLKYIYDIDSKYISSVKMTVKDFYILHEKCMKKIHGDNKPKFSFDKSADEFFGQYVNRYIEHDKLHEYFKHTEIPMYKKILKGEVSCDKNKWDELSSNEKIYCALEEIYVIASERYLIPKILKGDSNLFVRLSFMKAMNSLSTTMTSGFFRDFLIDNYDVILLNYNPDYYKILYDVVTENSPR